MTFLSSEITTFEQSNTRVAETPIAKAEITFDDIARVGQVPRIKTSTGFSLTKPFKKTESLFS